MMERNRATQPVTVRISAARVEQLDVLAVATDRTRAWHVEQALNAYLEVQRWQLQHMKEGLAQLERDEGVSQEEIEAYLDTWGKDGKARPRQ